ncbi:hypothetical protein [Paraburkholderia sp. BR14320]|uniref:hypothetical protein n=1 Tax=unclassified Paraburkholderia TaxID=2615204 RepID=UPI0034CD14A4
MSFAHLSSVGRGKQAKADDKDYRDEEEDDDKQASARAEDDENDSGDEDAKAEDPAAEDDDDEDEKKAPEGKKAKRAKAEDDSGDDDEKKDEDDSEELHGKSAIACARLREQARCAAIMGCRAAGRNVPLAAQLALTTRMTRQEAIAVLEAAPAAAIDTSAGRAARNPRLGAGGEKSGGDRATAIAASWDRAFEKVGAVRRK